MVTATAPPKPRWRGTIRLGFDRFFAGVEITVTDPDGVEIGRTATDAEGRWSIAVPHAGTYLVTLDVHTLPNDSGLREGQEATVETTVFGGMARAVVFAVGETPKTTPFGERFAQRAFTGLKLGMIIAMSAVGLSLIYGTTGLVNFAHGELVTFGAVIAWYFNTSWGGLDLVVAAALALIVCGALGAGPGIGSFSSVAGTTVRCVPTRCHHDRPVAVGPSSHPTVLRCRTPSVQRLSGSGPLGSSAPWAVTPREAASVAIIAVVLTVVALTIQLTRFGKATRAGGRQRGSGAGCGDRREPGGADRVDSRSGVGRAWRCVAGS